MALGPVALGVFGACLPGAGPGLALDDAAAPDFQLGGDGGAVRVDADLGDPFAIVGLTPSHGPFTGGTRTRIDGRGFSSKLRVFVREREVPSESVLASDPTRAAIDTPPGEPGFAEVKVRDDKTGMERVLANGFFYDPVVISPSSGATSGGTRIALEGSGTSWVAGTTVSIGGAACSDVVVRSATRLECVTPAGAPGAKDLVVTVPGASPVQVRDAFTYSDSVDGFRGGLSGGALAGRIKVIAFDQLLGIPLPGAHVIVGDDLASRRRTAESGVVEIPDITTDKVTITVAAKCHAPITYVDVPVDTVTVYLPFVFEPACLKLIDELEDPVSFPGGAGPRLGGFVDGEVIFPSGTQEFDRGVWTTVPLPKKPTERRAAYLFEASTSPNGVFQLPPASQAITPETDGTTGYKYSLLTFPGNATVYAIAGLEDRSDPANPQFTPYSMGVVRGVNVPSRERVSAIDIKMDILFDHEVRIAANPPPPAMRGPDRFNASIALTLGASGYAILPRGTRTSALPTPEEISFVGVPALDRALANEQYVIGGIAATGDFLQLPASVVSRVRTSDANGPVSLGGFLPVPVPKAPSAGVWNGTRVEVEGVGANASLNELTVSSADGLVVWTIIAPGNVSAFDLPNLAALTAGTEDDPPVGIREGRVVTNVYSARIDRFEYGALRSGQLSAGAWNAYAADTVVGVYAPPGK
ncbi:MAG: IPT/TIG domain-containing protein [Labilithrix sp.]|nr:IPT/TIG domain-containing protein [Labilithrix sp.]MCW5814098.1 IPT/TIG domain-containing protein [Labilithrix sp.]